jgi:putative methionine-R-sulfoxide reductase with GAF domain
MDKKLVKYVSENLHKGYSMSEVSERLGKEGWTEDEIQTALVEGAKSHVHHARTTLAIIGFVSFLLLGVIVYSLVLFPSFVSEPVVEKPAIVEKPEATALVSAENIAYVMTELGAYKLHANPFTGSKPELEIVVPDSGQVFGVVVEDNKVQVVQGSAKSPDARITVDKSAFEQLANSENSQKLKEIAAKLYSEREQRNYTGELIAGKGDLLLKGYLSLYDEAKAMAGGEITGQAVAELEGMGSQIIGMFFIVAVLWGAVILQMALSGK